MSLGLKPPSRHSTAQGALWHSPAAEAASAKAGSAKPLNCRSMLEDGSPSSTKGSASDSAPGYMHAAKVSHDQFTKQHSRAARHT